MRPSTHCALKGAPEVDQPQRLKGLPCCSTAWEEKTLEMLKDREAEAPLKRERRRAEGSRPIGTILDRAAEVPLKRERSRAEG